jgi:hypothetical protein
MKANWLQCNGDGDMATNGKGASGSLLVGTPPEVVLGSVLETRHTCTSTIVHSDLFFCRFYALPQPFTRVQLGLLVVQIF